MSATGIYKYMDLFSTLVEGYGLPFDLAKKYTGQIIGGSPSPECEIKPEEWRSVEKVTIRSYLQALEKRSQYFTERDPVWQRKRNDVYMTAFADLLENRFEVVKAEEDLIKIKIWGEEITGHYDALRYIVRELMVDPYSIKEIK